MREEQPPHPPPQQQHRHLMRNCGCAHRYQPAAQQRKVVVRQRSQSATPLRSPRSQAPSRPTTPAQASPLTNGSRSRSEPHLGDKQTAAPTGRAGAGTPDSGRSSRATHWSRRSPEELARLARLRSTSRSPTALREAPPMTTPPQTARSRSADVGTGYGHSYSLPRPFDTTPTGRASRPHPQAPQAAGKFERSRAPSQSGATYYRSRGRSGASCSSCTSSNTGYVQATVSRTMSESSLVVEWQEEQEVIEEQLATDEATTAVDTKKGRLVNGHDAQQQQQPSYVSEFRMEPRCLPAGHSSTVLCRRDSTWRRFVEEVRFQKCLVPATAKSVPTAHSSAPPPPPPPPRRYRTELDVWVTPASLDDRQPIVLPVPATA